MLIMVMRNEEYAILKSFAALEHAPGVPGLDLPGLDIVSIATGYGCDAVRIDDVGMLNETVPKAWTKDAPTVVEVPISRQIPPLI